MRRRYQQGSVTQSSDGRYWVGKYRENGAHKTKLLGKLRKMTKSEAQAKLADILKPLGSAGSLSGTSTLRTFLGQVYFPFYERKWKKSTLSTNRDRIYRDLAGEFGDKRMDGFTKEELQAFLDSRRAQSFSTVDHLRLDLKQIFEMAFAEGLIRRNPALLLFTPRECPRPEHPIMTMDQIKLALTVLPLRERLIVKLAILAGMRPGEIFGMRRGRITENAVDVQERVYRGQCDTPKTRRSIRSVALSASIREDLEEWLRVSPGDGPDAWLFPSERLTTPISKDNAMYRGIRPKLEAVGLGWVDFQVMRRTHSSLMRELGVDPKVVADSMGHDIAVNLSVYTQTSMDSRLAAMETLGSALVN